MIEKQLADDRLYDFLYGDSLPDGDSIQEYLSASSDVGVQFGSGAVNLEAIDYRDGSTHAIGTVIQIRIFGGELALDAAQKIGKVRIRFRTERDAVVESVHDITLRR